MFVRTITKQAAVTTITGVLLTLTGALLLRYPEAVATGISRGMAVCTTVVIPTLYPFMLLAGLLTDSPLCRHPGSIARWISRRFFGLPGCCGPVILLGLVGGYPAGMLAAAELYRQKRLSPEQWRRMTAFCVGAGPGFVVSTVGAGLLGSAQAGWLLFTAQTVTSLGIGVWLGRRYRQEFEPLAQPLAKRPVAEMVADSCRALLTMCGFVMAAAMILSLLEVIGVARTIAAITGLESSWIAAFMAGLLEVSCGCVATIGLPLAPVWLSFMLSWGGLSVQGQLSAALPEEQLLTPQFCGWRVLHGLISAGITLLLFRLFPTSLQTMADGTKALPYSVSMQASVMLVLLCFLAMLCFSEKKTGNHQKDVL